MSQAGWYSDPSSPQQQRYFDGHNWTSHVQPAVPQYYAQPAHQSASAVVVATQQPKSVGLALLLTFFFGPLGMLYSTVVGGLVMLGLGVVLGLVTFGLWFIVAWPIQMIWAAAAASGAKQQTAVVVNQAAAYTQQPYPQQAYPQQTLQPTSQWSPPAAPISYTAPLALPTTAQESAESWYTDPQAGPR